MTTDQQQPGVGKFNARLEKVSPDGHRATFVMDGSQTFPGVFRREASTNEIAFWLEIESLRVQLADMQRQIEGRVTIAEEIERRREAVGRIRAERDEARAHLADMQRQADQTWQRFVASQQQIDALRAEIEQQQPVVEAAQPQPTEPECWCGDDDIKPGESGPRLDIVCPKHDRPRPISK